MVDVDKAVVAKYKSNGKTFEILVDSNSATDMKNGKKIDVVDVLAAEKIFADASKAREASPTELETVFGTSDVLEVAKKIIMKGDVPQSAQHKKEEQDQKLKKIVYLIHRNAIDSQQDTPIPSERIEDAMRQAKVKIDPAKSAEEQLYDVMHKLRPVIPIRFAVKELQIRVSPQYARKAYGVIKPFGKMVQEEWAGDGALVCVIQIPGGLEDEFYNKLNEVTHGNNQVEIING